VNGLTTNGASGARRFPDGFLWGAGTSAYQIEGAVNEDGRGRSIWDVFTHTPGNVRGGETGDIACDSYHRVAEDVACVAELGLGAYRFSIAWSRVLPSGRGPVNQAGLDYYRALVDGLRAHGVVPVATVYHWELPQALEDEGGWACRDTAEALAEYAAVLADALGDHVGMWTTLNEPQQSVHQGYRIGTHAPGHRDMGLAAAATHHLLLGHGLALQSLRAALPATVPVGIALDPHPYRALGEDAEPIAAQLDADHNRICMDPVLHGTYPAEAHADRLPPDALIHDGDLAAMSAPVDFVGLNYYRPHYIRCGAWSDLRAGESPVPDQPGYVEYLPPERPQTVMGWLVEPDGLYEILRRMHRETRGLPLYVTENGCAAEDYVNPDGAVNDTERVDYIHGHLDAVLRAIDDGVDVAGYFHWSLLDNFEWAWGYRRRFGLYYVDYATQRRLPKRSAAFYAGVIRSGELPALDPLVPEPALAPVAET
jgi:beta-glucosidase